MKFLKLYFYKLSTRCRLCCPKCYNVLLPDDSRKNVIIRGVLFYFGGLLLGALFWKFVLSNVGLPFGYDFIVGLGVTLFLGNGKLRFNENSHNFNDNSSHEGYGCALSVQIRCFSSLCLVSFLGRAGCGMLKAIVFSCILTGPINNISLNAREVVRVFTCSAVMTYNLSMVRFDLMTKPFQAALSGSKDNLDQMKDEFRTLVDITEPIKLEVEGYNGTGSEGRRKRESAEAYQRNYEQKLENRCMIQLERGVQRCKRAFSDVYLKCHEKLPSLVNVLLCWPLKIDFACSASRLFGDKEKICSSDGVIDPEFGRDYVQLKRAEQKLVGDLEQVEIKYEFVDMEHHRGYL